MSRVDECQTNFPKNSTPLQVKLDSYLINLSLQINENIRMVESTNRLEWLQSHVNLEGLGEVCIKFLSPLYNEMDLYVLCLFCISAQSCRFH